MGVGGYVDNDNGIHPRRLSSHPLGVSEIPSMESSVFKQQLDYWKKNSPLPWLVFFRQ
jgi:hypothetical protein